MPPFFGSLGEPLIGPTGKPVVECNDACPCPAVQDLDYADVDFGSGAVRVDGADLPALLGNVCHRSNLSTTFGSTHNFRLDLQSASYPGCTWSITIQRSAGTEVWSTGGAGELPLNQWIVVPKTVGAGVAAQVYVAKA